MGINFSIQKAMRQRGAASLDVSLEKDLRECMKCRFFYGNGRQCLAKHCVKETRQPEPDKGSECSGCPYKQSERYCFPCMKKILKTQEMEEETNG